MRLSLNKNALKQQRDHLGMYRRFLPSLDLKRQQLLGALKDAQKALADVEENALRRRRAVERILLTLGSSTVDPEQLTGLVSVREVELGKENIVGARVPVVRRIEVARAEYSRLTLPFWVDQMADDLEETVRIRILLQVHRERVRVLEAAARKITQRVNLFEKVLIPQAESNIRQIGIALSDQERASVVRSKLAKRKSRRQ